MANAPDNKSTHNDMFVPGTEGFVFTDPHKYNPSATTGEGTFLKVEGLNQRARVFICGYDVTPDIASISVKQTIEGEISCSLELLNPKKKYVVTKDDLISNFTENADPVFKKSDILPTYDQAEKSLFSGAFSNENLLSYETGGVYTNKLQWSDANVRHGKRTFKEMLFLVKWVSGIKKFEEEFIFDFNDPIIVFLQGRYSPLWYFGFTGILKNFNSSFTFKGEPKINISCASRKYKMGITNEITNPTISKEMRGEGQRHDIRANKSISTMTKDFTHNKTLLDAIKHLLFSVADNEAVFRPFPINYISKNFYNFFEIDFKNKEFEELFISNEPDTFGKGITDKLQLAVSEVFSEFKNLLDLNGGILAGHTKEINTSTIYENLAKKVSSFFFPRAAGAYQDVLNTTEKSKEIKNVKRTKIEANSNPLGDNYTTSFGDSVFQFYQFTAKPFTTYNVNTILDSNVMRMWETSFNIIPYKDSDTDGGLLYTWETGKSMGCIGIHPALYEGFINEFHILPQIFDVIIKNRDKVERLIRSPYEKLKEQVYGVPTECFKGATGMNLHRPKFIAMLPPLYTATNHPIITAFKDQFKLFENEYASIKQLLDNLLKQLQLKYYETPMGDIVLEILNYDFSPWNQLVNYGMESGGGVGLYSLEPEHKVLKESFVIPNKEYNDVRLTPTYLSGFSPVKSIHSITLPVIKIKSTGMVRHPYYFDDINEKNITFRFDETVLYTSLDISGNSTGSGFDAFANNPETTRELGRIQLAQLSARSLSDEQGKFTNAIPYFRFVADGFQGQTIQKLENAFAVVSLQRILAGKKEDLFRALVSNNIEAYKAITKELSKSKGASKTPQPTVITFFNDLVRVQFTKDWNTSKSKFKVTKDQQNKQIKDKLIALYKQMVNKYTGIVQKEENKILGNKVLEINVGTARSQSFDLPSENPVVLSAILKGLVDHLQERRFDKKRKIKITKQSSESIIIELLQKGLLKTNLSEVITISVPDIISAEEEYLSFSSYSKITAKEIVSAGRNPSYEGSDAPTKVRKELLGKDAVKKRERVPQNMTASIVFLIQIGKMPRNTEYAIISKTSTGKGKKIIETSTAIEDFFLYTNVKGNTDNSKLRINLILRDWRTTKPEGEIKKILFPSFSKAENVDTERSAIHRNTAREIEESLRNTLRGIISYYVNSSNFGIQIQKFIERLDPSTKNKTESKFVTQQLLIEAKLSGAYNPMGDFVTLFGIKKHIPIQVNYLKTQKDCAIYAISLFNQFYNNAFKYSYSGMPLTPELLVNKTGYFNHGNVVSLITEISNKFTPKRDASTTLTTSYNRRNLLTHNFEFLNFVTPGFKKAVLEQTHDLHKYSVYRKLGQMFEVFQPKDIKNLEEAELITQALESDTFREKRILLVKEAKSVIGSLNRELKSYNSAVSKYNNLITVKDAEIKQFDKDIADAAKGRDKLQVLKTQKIAELTSQITVQGVGIQEILLKFNNLLGLLYGLIYLPNPFLNNPGIAFFESVKKKAPDDKRFAKEIAIKWAETSGNNLEAVEEEDIKKRAKEIAIKWAKTSGNNPKAVDEENIKELVKTRPRLVAFRLNKPIIVELHFNFVKEEDQGIRIDRAEEAIRDREKKEKKRIKEQADRIAAAKALPLEVPLGTAEARVDVKGHT